MQYERSHIKYLKRSVKQHIKYFNFLSKIPLYHLVLLRRPYFSQRGCVKLALVGGQREMGGGIRKPLKIKICTAE